MMRVLDIFSGIGGFSLGLERTAGFKTVAFCEIEPFCRRVLAKHWPGVPCYDDVRTLSADRLTADGVSVDVICGGFPCQDISTAGKGAGIDGARSGLWSEYARLIGELRPIWVLVENVPALRSRGADRVLSDLEELGYSCWPAVVGAVHAGAQHLRQRVWILAHARRVEHQGRSAAHQWEVGDILSLADADRTRQPQPQRGLGPERGWPFDGSEDLANANGQGLEVKLDGIAGQLAPFIRACQWPVEPDVGRVAHGVPARVDRLKSLGNAVVPQVVTMFGRAIMEASCR